jgi:GNAT superfamily N-acetyltransferase
MPEFHLRQLPAECRPLLNKFYRAHRSHMRVPAGACCWVAENTDIVAGLCMTRIADGRWLTGLLVAPNQRNQGLAKRLVARALAASEGAVWLFCEPKLIRFYQQLGFSEPAMLPGSLASRLQRYNRNKTLVALWHENERAVCPLPF